MGKTNVVYDPETNEDRPLFFCCCGKNCPLNARYWFLALTILGIAASIWTCESAEYFSFTSLRNDTFYDLDKKQPEPFQFATEADVGMFKYRINAVFVYPELDELNEGSEVDINQDIQEGSNIGQVQSYELGADQFDSDRAFSTAQKGAFIGPIMAGVSLFFCLIEVCFVQYPCSWLPTAFFMFMAFTFQLFTVFLFLSEDFCGYAQECTFGVGWYMTILAIVCYFVAQMIICCAPRPNPIFKLQKPKKRYQKKKRLPTNYEESPY